MNKPTASQRKRTPQTLQMEATECGVACLAMVLAFHGCHVPLAELRSVCEVSREGSRATNLLRAARSYGLEARGWRARVSGLAEVSLPAILFWNSSHFIVLEGWTADRKWFWINDPAFGHRRVSAEDFARSFSEVVLTFAPGAGFQRRAAPAGLFSWVWQQVRTESRAALFVGLASLLLVAPSLAVPLCMRVFVDDYYIGGEYHWLWPLVGGLALAAVIQLGLSISMRRVMLRWEMRQAEKGTRQLLRQLERVSRLDRLARGPTELAARWALPVENAALIFRQLGGWLGYLPTAVASVIWMSFYGWKLAAVLYGLILGTSAVLGWVNRGRWERQAEVGVVQACFENTVVRGLALLEALKFGGQEGFLRRLEELRGRIFFGEQKLAVWQLNGRVLLRFQVGLAFAGILVVGTMEVMEGRLTVGALMAFLVLWLPLHGWLMDIFSINRGLRQLAINRERLADLPALEEGSSPAIERLSLLELKEVTFGYSRLRPPLLSNVTLNIRPGQRIALVGPNNCGKSTLTRLMAGMLEAQSGGVYLNGETLRPDTCGGCVVWADSEPVLLARTSEEHVRIGNELLSPEDVEAVFQVAGVSHELAARRLAPGAANLSGGQRQQVEMARLLARSPQLVILDDATSAMDIALESQVADEWQRRGCAWLWVTQRSGIVRRADEIWMLAENGSVERGTWEQLAKRSTLFCQLMGL